MSWRELWELYQDFLEGPNTQLNLAPRYNLAPSQRAPILLSQGQQRQIQEARWGLVPSWAKDEKIGYKLINARAETVAEKPSFRAAYRARRCLVPASGFYEWRKQEKGTKQPYYITCADGQPMTFAGLWEAWLDKEADRQLLSFTIITPQANAFMAELHDRMPVILDAAQFGSWLDAGADDVRDLLHP